MELSGALATNHMVSIPPPDVTVNVQKIATALTMMMINMMMMTMEVDCAYGPVNVQSNQATAITLMKMIMFMPSWIMEVDCPNVTVNVQRLATASMMISTFKASSTLMKMFILFILKWIMEVDCPNVTVNLQVNHATALIMMMTMTIVIATTLVASLLLVTDSTLWNYGLNNVPILMAALLQHYPCIYLPSSSLWLPMDNGDGEVDVEEWRQKADLCSSVE